MVLLLWKKQQGTREAMMNEIQLFFSKNTLEKNKFQFHSENINNSS